jgi:ABC-2 type transport system ATP-binding protein
MPASVSVCDLARRYGPVEALRGVSFEVGEGEIFGLLGPNGAGKTTALECILGLRRADSGRIRVAGVDVDEARMTMGAQIQGAMLQDPVTPRRALNLFASFYSNPAPVEGLIDAFGLREKRDAPFSSLSAGQRQRLFLALALVNNPRVVVLDEPTAGLDPLGRRELHEVIVQMRASGKTILVSTHDLEEAASLCDRVGIIDKGSMVAAGTPAALIAGADPCSRVRFRIEGSVQASDLAFLAGVVGCERTDGAWMLKTAAPGATIIALARCLDSRGCELLDLQVTRPTLEDAFLSLTGKGWLGGDERIP